MIIKSKQIVDQIELLLGKFIDDITKNDLDNISELTINGFDVAKKHLDFNIEDLLLFNNLKKITFNNFILDVDTMNYIFNSKIEELNIYNCELLCEITSVYENIKVLRVEYTSNFDEKYLSFFPNIKELAYKGYTLKHSISNNIEKLDLMNTKIDDTKIIEKANVNTLYLSKDEYENHKDFYDKLIITIKVYDDNNCYFIGKGDDNE